LAGLQQVPKKEKHMAAQITQNDLAETINNTLNGLWEMQTKNYDIVENYLELLQTLDLDNTDLPGAMAFFAGIGEKCQQILTEEKPAKDPVIPDMFTDNLCPIPNNPGTKALIKALFYGGEDMQYGADGWRLVGNRPVFESKESSGGLIKVSLAIPPGGNSDENQPEKQQEMVRGISAFTVDVLIGVLGQICHNFCENKTDEPHRQDTVVSASQLLKYKNIKVRGQTGWKIKEAIDKELQVLAALRISMKKIQDPMHKTRQLNDVDCEVFTIRKEQRRFNVRTCAYTPTAWKITPGRWLSQWLSTKTVQFIGNLNQDLYQLDHRKQRGVDRMAKKIGYAFFTLPGGTYYLKNGIHRSVSQYLKSIGDYTEIDDRDKDTMGRKLRTFNKALDRLAELKLCESEDKSWLEKPRSGRGSVKNIMSRKIMLNPGEVLKIKNG
jgi:hypothetical protein